MSSSFQGTAYRKQRWLDGFSVVASMLCLIHCLLLPALLVALPVMAAMPTVPEGFHAVAFMLALPISVLAMASGRRRHAQRWPMIVAATGLVLLGTGAFAVDAEAVERMLSTIGAVLLAVAHVGNWRAVSQRAGRRIAGAAECGA